MHAQSAEIFAHFKKCHTYEQALNGGSPASYAVRFAAGCDGVFMTLSGMSDLAQINDSLSYMKEFRPLDEKELEAVRNVCRVLHTMKVIPCTSAALSGISAFPPIPRLVAHKVLDTGMIDMMMFSLNPAYNLECGDEYGIGTANERAALLRRAQTEGVGVSVMKPFHGGQPLSAKTSPFRQALTKNQCIRYCLARPAVLAVVPGVRGMKNLDSLLSYMDADKEECDYALIGAFTPQAAMGNRVYCNHCQPCPAGIDIGIVNKYYDLSLAGDRMAHDHYGKLTVRADACLGCGHWFRVHQQSRMKEIAAYFNKEN